MGNKTSRATKHEEGSRGSRGCFGWVAKAFRKKRGRRHKDAPHESLASEAAVLANREENSASTETVNVIALSNSHVEDINEVNIDEEEISDEKEDGRAEACSTAAAVEDVGEERQDDEELVAREQEPEVVMTWAEEVDDAEEKGLDVFAPLTSCLPHTASVPSVLCDSTQNETTAAAATDAKMSACQRRRARRRAVAAARKASAASETAATLDESRASAENEAAATTVPDTTPADNSDEPPAPDTTTTATRSGTSATKRRRARRQAATARIRSEALHH